MSIRKDTFAWSPADDPGEEQVTDDSTPTRMPARSPFPPAAVSVWDESKLVAHGGKQQCPQERGLGPSNWENIQRRGGGVLGQIPKGSGERPSLESLSCWGVESQPGRQALMGMRTHLTHVLSVIVGWGLSLSPPNKTYPDLAFVV